MGETSIEWTEQTWNPVRGCKMVSPGCANCYAMRMAGRLSGKGQPYHGLVQLGSKGKGFRWTGDFREVPELLDALLRRKKPTTFFVNSMSDLFGEGVSDEYIAAVFGVMAACPQHTFQVLTKRAERMARWSKWIDDTPHPYDTAIYAARAAMDADWQTFPLPKFTPWPLPNVWLGVSVESQEYADERIPHLLRTPAAVRFLSMEPLLGPVDLDRYFSVCDIHGEPSGPRCKSDGSGAIDWVIVGGESGHGARPMHPDWARSIRDQCDAAGVPFFFKQWGEYGPPVNGDIGGPPRCVARPNGLLAFGEDGVKEAASELVRGESVILGRHGKKAAGRILDGRTWDEMPEVGS